MKTDHADIIEMLDFLNLPIASGRFAELLRSPDFIDDFAISRYSEEGMKILYHLIKMKADLGTSTLFTSQYSPDEWGKYLSDEKECYGKLDGIRRRLTTGFTVLIEKAE